MSRDLKPYDNKRDGVDMTSSEAREQLAHNEAQLHALRDEMEKTEGLARDHLRSNDEKALAATDVILLDLKQRTTRLDRMIEQTQAHLRDAIDREKEASRKALYDRAVAMCVEADAWIATTYVDLAERMRKGLLRLSEIEEAVRATNRDLPNGAEAVCFEGGRNPNNHLVTPRRLFDTVSLPGVLGSDSVFWDDRSRCQLR